MTGECNLKELHEFKNNYNDGFITKTFIATLASWYILHIEQWWVCNHIYNSDEYVIIYTEEWWACNHTYRTVMSM